MVYWRSHNVTQKRSKNSQCLQIHNFAAGIVDLIEFIAKQVAVILLKLFYLNLLIIIISHTVAIKYNLLLKDL